MRSKNLPALPDDADVEPDVLEGQIVDEPRAHQVIVLRPVVNVVTHRHTRWAARHVGRHGAYIPIGVGVLARRWWDAHTTSRFERSIRRAEAQGDHENAQKWEELRQKFLQDRGRRRHDRTTSVLTAIKTTPYIIGGGSAALIFTGIALAVAERRFSAVGAPFKFVSEVVYWSVIVIGAAAVPVLIGAPCVFLSVAWHIGRRHAQGLNGGWLAAPKKQDDGHLVVTADTIVLALKNLQLPALTRAFSDGWMPTFTTVPIRDGKGYAAEFSVPLGVTPAMVADKREILARNVHRDTIETWPSAGAPGHVKVFVADPGAISKNAPEYPLQHSGQADVFTGVPAGVTPRGDEILVPIVANNGIAGGLPGTGKSNAIRVVLLGCCTDPLCQVEAYVGALNGDFDAFAPRLARYVKGLDDEQIAAMVTRLGELYEEVGRREARLAELGAKKLTRQLAQQHPGLRPIVAAFSEAHELFGHAEHGELAAELATKLVKRGRKTGVVAWFDTQSARAAAIPPSLVENVSVNICFAVRSWRNNDGFLKDGSFAAGIRATELSPQRDRGTSLATGVSDEAYELLRWYLIEVDDDAGTDDATEVIERCMQTVDPRTPVESTSPVIAIESRDLLKDLAQVLDGSQRVKLRDLVGLLRRLAPTWAKYKNLTATQLRAILDDEGVKTINTSGTHYLDPAELHRVLAGRIE